MKEFEKRHLQPLMKILIQAKTINVHSLVGKWLKQHLCKSYNNNILDYFLVERLSKEGLDCHCLGSRDQSQHQ